MTTPNPADELFHPVGEHGAWSESYYFNFVDPATGVGAFTRMGFRPNDGWADALHVVYLPGTRVAFTYGRRSDVTAELIADLGEADPQVGNLTLRRGAAFERWDIVYAGPAQDVADPTVMLAATRDRPEGWAVDAHLDMAVAFEAIAPPHYAAGGSQGHFEQTGRATGTIALGDESWTVDGFGVRDKSWGPRTWQAPAARSGANTGGAAASASGCFLNWFSMNFGADLALGGACVRAADGRFLGQGWLQRDGVNLELHDVEMTTEFDLANPLVHRAVHLRGTDSSGQHVDVDGEVTSLCPTKIPGRGTVTFVNEGLARFRTGDRVGYGIAEHWHALAR